MSTSSCRLLLSQLYCFSSIHSVTKPYREHTFEVHIDHHSGMQAWYAVGRVTAILVIPFRTLHSNQPCPNPYRTDPNSALPDWDQSS